MKYLVEEKGVKFTQNDVGRTPLHASSQRGNPKVVEWIVTNNYVDPTIEDNTGAT